MTQDAMLPPAPQADSFPRTLTQHPAGSRHSGAASSRQDPRGGSAHRVLWIDDELSAGSAEIKGLAHHGFTVDCVQTGAAGIALATQCSYGAILLDVRLPDQHGLDVLQALVPRRTKASVVVVTGFCDINLAVHAMKLGAADVRTKPVGTDELADLLRELPRRPPVPQPALDEAGWLQIQCERLAECVTRAEALALVARTLLDRRLSLRCFFGCADAIRLAYTLPEDSTAS